MYTLYFKIAVRYLLKHKLYSFINILGLAIGVASFILIMVYVNHEYSYDTFEGSEQVYRPYMDYLEGDTYVPSDAMTYNLTGPTLKREFPEVLDYVTLYYFEKLTFILGDKILEQPLGSMAEQSFFDIFSYKLLKGDRQTVLQKPNSIVLTKSLSDRLFGNQDPINKNISAVRSGEKVVLTVTGIMQDIPKNSHFRNTFLISYETENTWKTFDKNHIEPNWNLNNFYTYIKVDKNANIEQLRKKIMDSDIEKDETERHNIEALQDIHLYSNKPYEVEVNGSITRIKFLTSIAFIILILSWLNYINLSTTKSLERAKEIGIRKVAGAQRTQLILQSLLESIILNIIALTIAIILTYILLPLYNSFTAKELSIQLSNIGEFLPILMYIFLGMILAGLYPALLLSGYSPIRALKGKIRTSVAGLHIRKGLIIAQFIATIILAIGTIVINKQIKFLQEQPVGADLNQIVSLRGTLVNSRQNSLIRQDYKVLKSELQNLPFVEKIASANTYPGDSFDNLSSSRGITLPNGEKNEKVIYYAYGAQSEYFDMVDIDFVTGTTFLPSHPNANNVVVSQNFLKVMGIDPQEDVVNKTIKFWGNEWLITGVIKDYYHFGLKNPILPIVIGQSRSNKNLLVKLDAKASSNEGFTNAIAQIKSKWELVFLQSTFEYTLLDQKFESQYIEDKKFSVTFNIFTALAILIAALGLFGLTSYTCIQRKKEIGIRKVNGASIFKILKLLNIDFIKWVGIAFVIAIPIAWFAMNSWLENFALKTSISWWVYALAGIMALGITLLTVSWQSFRAANGNPVDALRDE